MDLPIYYEGVTTQHQLDSDSTSTGCGYIGSEHRSLGGGGLHLVLLEVPDMNFSWSLTFRHQNIVYKHNGIEFNCSLDMSAPVRIQKASFVHHEGKFIIEILADFCRGRELYFHCHGIDPSKIITLTTYHVKNNKIL